MDYTPFPNLAGSRESDAVCTAELEAAGIAIVKLPEFLRKSEGEVGSIVIGSLGPWSFKRGWYYWIAKGPGIPPLDATSLHAQHGKVVRALWSTLPSPPEWYKGFAVGHYHVDAEEGLKALAQTIIAILIIDDKDED